MVALWRRRRRASQRPGQPYLSIRYSERLAEAGVEPSVGSVGDSYDNALAETIIGLFKTEVIHHRGPWRHLEAVEYATLEWVDWFNHRRLLEPIGNVPPAELELAYHRQQSESAVGSLTQTPEPPENPGRFIPPHLRKGKFRPPDRLIALLKTKS